MSERRFVGFYPYPDLWVGAPPDLALDGDKLTDESVRRLREDVLEVEASSWEIRVARDGLVLLNLASLDLELAKADEEVKKDIAMDNSGPIFESVWLRYLQHVNVLHFLLACAQHHNRNMYLIQFSELGLFDCERVIVGAAGPLRHASYGHSRSNYLRRFNVVRLQSVPGAMPAPVDLFQDMADLYRSAYSGGHVEYLRRPAKALSEYRIRNYTDSYVVAWFVIENWVHSEYAKLGVPPNKNDWQVSYRMKKLLQRGALDKPTYDELDDLRVRRNGIAHAGAAATQGDAQQVIERMRSCAEQHTRLPLPFATNPSPILGL